MIVYKRPITEPPKGRSIIGVINFPYTHIDKNGLDIPYQLSFFVQYYTSNMPAGTILTIDESKITIEYKRKLRKFIELKEKCSSVAEILNYELGSFLIQYYKNEIDSKVINELSFSEQRDYLSEIIKNDSRFFSIEKLNTATKRKSFRKLFADFIYDRNIYTHGIIRLRLNDGTIFLFYKQKNTDGESDCIINEEIVDSYFKAYNYLIEVMRDIKKKVDENYI